MESDVLLLLFVGLATVVSAAWLTLEISIRRSVVRETRVMDRRTVRGEGTAHSVLVSLPGPAGAEEIWVRFGRRRFEAVVGLETVGLHVLDLGSRTMVRPAGDWGRVWLLGLATLFFAVNLIDGLVDDRFG